MKKTTYIFAVMAVALTACSGGSTVSTEVLPSEAPEQTTTTSDPSEPIVFGSGVMPDTMPEGFPIPAEAVIGSTLIDRDRNVTEVIVRIPAAVEPVAQFFETNLPNRGYDVAASSGGETAWDIEFGGEGFGGTIAITLGAQDVSQAVIRVTADG